MLFRCNTALCPIVTRNPARVRFSSSPPGRRSGGSFPKAGPIKGLKPAKSAAREAYEEAGIRGSVKTKAIGIFSYEKRSNEDGITIPCDVRVFPLLVKRQSKAWPESEQRIAQWLEPTVALSLVEEESLRSLISRSWNEPRLTLR